jgi:glycosyltransferase involved in cell wall biosynthesis
MTAEREDVDFYLAGEHHWKNPFAEELIRQVEIKSLASRIHFTGEIDDVFGLLRQCDLHVCPSTSAGESFPNVVLEAKSQGLPSVVFPTAGLTEAVTHLVDGYVCSEKSSRALYDGLRYFLEDAAALKDAGNSARRSLDKFSKDSIAGEWAALFRHGTK